MRTEKMRHQITSWNIALTTFALGQSNSCKTTWKYLYQSETVWFFSSIEENEWRQDKTTYNTQWVFHLFFALCTTATDWSTENSCFLLLKYLFGSFLVSLNKIPVSYSHSIVIIFGLFFFVLFQNSPFVLCNPKSYDERDIKNNNLTIYIGWVKPNWTKCYMIALSLVLVCISPKCTLV